MAISGSSLTSNISGTDATSYTTASISPTANNLLILAVVTRITAPTVAPTTVTGGGVTTWTQFANFEYRTSGAAGGRVTLYRALQSSYTSGTIVIGYNGVTQGGAAWSVSQFSGTSTSGSNGAGAIVQTGTSVADASGTSGTVTLSAFGSTSNAGYGAFAGNVNQVTANGSGWTELSDNATTGPPAGALETEYKINDNVVTASWVTLSSYGIIGVEIAAEVSSPSASLSPSASISPSSSASPSPAFTPTQTNITAIKQENSITITKPAPIDIKVID